MSLKYSICSLLCQGQNFKIINGLKQKKGSKSIRID